MTDGLTRSQLLRRAAAGGAFLTVPGVLAACGGTSKKAASTTASKTLAKTLRFSNWTLYIDINEKTKRHPTLDAFKKKTGTTVQYTEDINDNATYFGKIQGPLSRGQSIDRDIIVMTDNSRYPSLLIKKGWVEKLDKSAIPNIKNLEPSLQHPNWDPNRDYSLPWQSGLTGIAYNDQLTDPVLTVPDLLENPKLKGKVTLLQGMGDTMPLIMSANGDDPTKVTDASWNRAMNVVTKAVNSGQIRQFTGNDYSGPLAKGDLKAAVAWTTSISTGTSRRRAGASGRTT
jgi:spermidine/putrescine transport system substrate-binding protein